MTLPLKKRRRMLRADPHTPQIQPYRVELSTMRLIKTAKELSDAFTESVQQNLEGLMIKDPNANTSWPTASFGIDEEKARTAHTYIPSRHSSS